jgi:hypothetical protein
VWQKIVKKCSCGGKKSVNCVQPGAALQDEDPDSSIRHESDPDFACENELKGQGRNTIPKAFMNANRI